jgi:serpin B
MRRLRCRPASMITPLGGAILTFTLAIPQGPAPTTEGAAAHATTHLGLTVFRALSAETPHANVFVSPDSIATALAIVAAGARDETLAEMKQVLGLPAATAETVLFEGLQLLHRRLEAGRGNASDAQRQEIRTLRDQLAAANGRVVELERTDNYREAEIAHREAVRLARQINDLLPNLDRYDLDFANALWVDRTFPVLPDYIANVDRWFGAGAAQLLDFRRDHVGAARTINAWVAARTNQRIRDLLTPEDVPSTTGMIVTNTVWFRGEWRTPFEERFTTTQPFHLANGTETPVSLMRDQWRSDVPYAAFGGDGAWFRTPDEVPADPAAKAPPTYPDARGFQMIELPYKGDTVSMLVLVPLAHDGLSGLEKLITVDRLRAWTARLKERTADVALPRFRLDGTYELADALKTAGMRRAFVSPDQAGGAQFGGISSSRDPREQLFVASVRHRSFVEVNEKGTEAAAATAISMLCGAAAPRTRPFHPVVHADRPFLFVIRDVETGAVLFLGRHVDPRR